MEKNYKQLFEKAYSRLIDIYGRDFSAPDNVILSRFYQEKAILGECELYMRYLELLSSIRQAAEKKGEHIFLRGTIGASFIAYLLGATDINPLPRHEYCPDCHCVKFIGSDTPFDKTDKKCFCSGEIETDGHNIPFEMNLKSILAKRIQFCVSYSFFDEAKSMISDAFKDKAVVALKDDDTSPVWFCIPDEEYPEPEDCSLSENRELFAHFPRITLVPDPKLDKYRKLQEATGFKMKDIDSKEEAIAFFRFMQRDVQGVLHFDNAFVQNIWGVVQPQSYDDLLKIIGLAHSTNVWKNNAEILFEKHRFSLRDIPAYREDLFEMISEQLYKKGIYDKGFAYEVTNKAMRGYYTRTEAVDEDTVSALSELGFDIDFVIFLSGISYMFTKAQGVLYLREAIALMFYKTKFTKEYNEIITEISSDC